MAGPVERLAERRAAAEVENRIHISPRLGYVYVAVPKAACSTVKRRLARIELLYRPGRPPRLVHDKAASPMLGPADLPPGEADWLLGGAAFRFAFVRNPFARALSAWADKIAGDRKQKVAWARAAGRDPDTILGTPVSFREFLEGIAGARPGRRHDPHWAPQAELLRPDAVTYDLIGRVERFEEDWARIEPHLVADPADAPARESLRRHATGADARLGAAYGAAEADLVRAIYAEDFRAFGYPPDPAGGGPGPEAEP